MSLDLDKRQRAMLAEMGVRVWEPAPPASLAPDQPTTTGHSVPHGSADSASSPARAQAAAQPNVPSGSGQERAAAPHPAGPVATNTARAVARAGPASGTHPQTADTPAAITLRTVEQPQLAERASAIAQMDWAQLQTSVAGCSACKLCSSRRNTVFGSGDTQADWLIVGEAPGETEDRLGQPFVGPAGQLLDSMLKALHLARSEGVYIANVLKCRPPANRNPQPDEVALCEPYLQRQVALLQPKIILAMGRFAVQSLLQSSEPIGKLRGHSYRYQGVPLVVTYHPAYLLRNLPDKAKAWADLCLAQRLLAAG